LALLTPAATSWRYLSSGALAGAAVLCRLDAVFALPFLAGIVLIEIQPWPRAARRVVALASGFLFTVAVSAAVNRVTILDSLSIGAYFSHIQARGYEWQTSLLALLFFFGPVMPALLTTGILRTGLVGINGGNWPHAACFVVYPLLLTAFAIKTGREVRYIYPLLAPVIALHGGRGVEWILAQLHKPAGERRALPLLAVFGVAVITFFVPPSGVTIADGPRAVLGRFWTPVLWWRWQRGVGQSMAQLAGFVDRLDREPATLVLTSHWNDEFFLRLRLSERGYINSTAAETFAGCEIALTSSIEEHSTPAEMFAAAREANRGHSALTRERWP
jgi:hypothetical protein